MRLDSRASLIKGGDDGAVIDEMNPRAQSRLIKAIGYGDDDLQMPPQPAGKLPAAEIATLTAWIERSGSLARGG